MKVRGVSFVALLFFVFGPQLFAQSTAAPPPASPAAAQSAQSGAGGPPTPTIRGYVTRVVLDVVVTDAKGKVVTGLTKDDFKVTDAGEPRTVTAFDVSAVHMAKPDV